MPSPRRSGSTPSSGSAGPKAADKIRDDVDVLLMFHNFPAEHWVHHLKTSNPIESRPRVRSPRDQARNPFHNS